MTVRGPYVYPSGKLAGRRYVVIVDGDERRQILYSRHLMEVALGRRLDPSEIVDHVDEDPTNDDLGNLQLLTVGQNNIKSLIARGATAEMITFICPVCGQAATRKAARVRGNRKQGKAGPFCSRSCARAWQVAHKPA